MVHAVIEIATAVGAVVTACSALYGTWKLIPWLKDQGELIQENRSLRLERDEARDAAKAFQQSSDGWQAAVEQMGSELAELRTEIKSLSTTLGASIMYIVECSEADRNRRPLPEPPDELRPLIEKAYLKAHPDRRSTAREETA